MRFCAQQPRPARSSCSPSTDFDEVAALADRALVMVRGAIDAELSGDDLTSDRLVQASYARGDAEPGLEASAR